MKVTIQTIDRKCVDIEFDDSVDPPTISDLKQKISEVKNHPVDQIKLIFEAKVLDDDNKLLSDYKITNGKKIVAMLQKPKDATPEVKKPELEKIVEPVKVPEKVPDQPTSLPPIQQVNVSDWQNSTIQPDSDPLPFNFDSSTGSNVGGNMNTMFTQLIQQNPQFFVQMLMSDPQIQQIAQQNPQGFAQFISDPNFLNNVMQHTDEDYNEEDEQMYQNFFGGQINLTDAEKLEVEEIVNMGLGTFEDTLQYYVAMNRDKEATVNALLDR